MIRHSQPGRPFDDATAPRVNDPKTYFFLSEGVCRAVDGVSYTLHENKSPAIVGESGCGKSVSALSILRLIHPPG